MSGGLAMRPMPTQAPDEDTPSMMASAKKAQVIKERPISKMGIPKKEVPPAPPAAEGGEENPADYKLMNSPTEGVFLQNMKTGKAMSLLSAKKLPGFEALVKDGMEAGAALAKEAFGKL